MKFSGIQKVSLIDYPNKVASVIFTPGCNLRCPFCHNWRIAVNPKPPFLQENLVFKILESRKKYVDAVVVTGGEPTMRKELPKFLAKLKRRGFEVKLDTNGFYPEVLEECLPYVNYLAVDVKTCLAKYIQLGAKETGELMRTVELLKLGKVPYEFRTTVVPELVTAKDMVCIGEIVKGAKTHALQQFAPEDTFDKKLGRLEPYGSKTIMEFAEIMKNYVEEVLIRL